MTDAEWASLFAGMLLAARKYIAQPTLLSNINGALEAYQAERDAAKTSPARGVERRVCDCHSYCTSRNTDRGGVVRAECLGLPPPPQREGGE